MPDSVGSNLENSMPSAEPAPSPKPIEATTQARKIVATIDASDEAEKSLTDIASIKQDEDDTQRGEDINSRKSRIDSTWDAWEDVQKVPELVALFDRKTPFPADQDPQALLKKYGYPQRTRIPDLKFDTWTVNLNQKFIKDGYIYLLRGDHPNLDHKGFYTRTYGYGKKTTEQLTHDLRSSSDVGYALYGNDAYLKSPPHSDNIAQELAFKQSQIGGSSFISTTSSLDAAIAGTGNNPDPEEQKNYEVYVVKIPTDAVINSNTGNFFGMEENEFLVPDYITPDEIVAKFPASQREAIYEYMHTQFGVTREDLSMTAKDEAQASPSIPKQHK